MSDIFSHPIPAVIVLLGVLVFVHEFGHFIVGRWAGIAVKRFSIGFGPRIFGFHRKGTHFLVSWIPLGGYVEFAGARPGDKVPEGLEGIGFCEASLTKRALAIAAGPIANILLAVVVYTTLGLAGIPHPPAEIGMVINDSPAEAAGFEYGDRVIQIGEAKIDNWRHLEKEISESPEKTLPVTVIRDGKEVTLSLTPDAVRAENILGKEVKIGRAGVALGRVPALVSLVDPEGAAAKAGVETGDRVETLSFEGKDIAIKYYPQLEREVERALAAGVREFSLVLRKAPPPGEEPDPAMPTRTANITLPETVVGDFQADVGLTHSMLTVGSAQNTLEGVLQAGDRMIAFNDQPLRHYFHLEELVEKNAQENVNVTIARDGAVSDVAVQLYGVDIQKPEGKVTLYTFPVTFWGYPEAPDPVIEQYSNPFAALGFGIKETTIQSGALVGALWHLIKGDLPLKSLGGPILIGKVAGDAARRGWRVFIGSMALISINLAVINLFPIPVLDGGQLVLIGAEAIRRRPLRPSSVENFQKVGVAMILSLVVLAMYNDLSRFWKSMLESVVGIFQ